MDLSQCLGIIFNYCRIRNEELTFVLTGLYDLELRPGTLRERSVNKGDTFILNVEICHETIRDYLLSESTAHLYVLYSLLCDLMGVVAGSEWVSLTGTDASPRLNDEAKMTDSIRNCLQRIGYIFCYPELFTK